MRAAAVVLAATGCDDSASTCGLGASADDTGAVIYECVQACGDVATATECCIAKYGRGASEAEGANCGEVACEPAALITSVAATCVAQVDKLPPGLSGYNARFIGGSDAGWEVTVDTWTNCVDLIGETQSEGRLIDPWNGIVLAQFSEIGQGCRRD